MPQSALEKFVQQLSMSLSGPNGRKGGNYGTDAPGTNSRRDVSDPERRGDTPDSGKGMPDSLGYAQHGDAPRLAQGQRAMELARQRFPELAHKGPAGPAIPEYNILYDGLRTDDAYDKIIYNTAHGSFVVGTTVTQPVTLDVPANLRTSRFPGAIQVHPVLLMFAFSQSVTTATGQYTMQWILGNGDLVHPLGEYNAGKADALITSRWVIPMNVTDPGITSLGTFQIISTGVVGTPTILWRMGFGWAYDLPSPAFRGYVPLEAGAWQRYEHGQGGQP